MNRLAIEVTPNPTGAGFIVLFQYPGSTFVLTEDNGGEGFPDETSAWDFGQKLLDEYRDPPPSDGPI